MVTLRKLPQVRYAWLWLWLALTAVGALPSAAAPAYAKSEADQQTPAYSRLFEQALAMEAKGDRQAALRLLSRVYDTEIPVQTFYDTLDRHKLRILAGLSGADVIITGRQTYTLDELRQYFTEALLPRPDVLHHDLRLEAELPLARLLHLYAVMGRDQPMTGDNPLVKPAAPGVDLAKAVAATDPWLVSAALFLARKGLGDIEPKAVIARWERRPDLWDDVCTEQALLFLAGRAPTEIKALHVNDDFVSRQIDGLKPLRASNTPGLQILRYWRGTPMLGRNDYLKPAGCAGMSAKRILGIEREKPSRDRSGRPGREISIPMVKDNCHGGVIKLPVGAYVLSFSRDRAHGKSLPFELAPLSTVRLVIVVWGGI